MNWTKSYRLSGEIEEENSNESDEIDLSEVEVKDCNRQSMKCTHLNIKACKIFLFFFLFYLFF